MTVNEEIDALSTLAPSQTYGVSRLGRVWWVMPDGALLCL